MIDTCQWCGERRDVSPDLQCVACADRSLRADQARERDEEMANARYEIALAQEEALHGDD